MTTNHITKAELIKEIENAVRAAFDGTDDRINAFKTEETTPPKKENIEMTFKELLNEIDKASIPKPKAPVQEAPVQEALNTSVFGTASLFGNDPFKVIAHALEILDKDTEIKKLRAHIAELENGSAKASWPQDGDEYWCINSGGQIVSPIWGNDDFDKGCLACGNIFRTKEEAKAANQVLLANAEYKRRAKAAWEAEGKTLDWSNGDQPKFQTYWKHYTGGWEIEVATNCETPFAVVFPTNQYALEVTKAIDAEFPGGLKCAS